MLFAGAGKDVLQGGDGIDTFVFETGDGRDTIVDFEKGTDLIDVIGWTAITDFNDLINNHASNHGNDVWIKAGSDVLIVKNMQKGDFSF